MVCTVHPLLPSSTPSSSTPTQLLPWSLQDDQDVSLHTCHILKLSSWDTYQLVHSNRGNFLDQNVYGCHTLPGCTVWKRSLSAKRGVLWHFLNDKISLGLFWAEKFIEENKFQGQFIHLLVISFFSPNCSFQSKHVKISLHTMNQW